MGPIRSYYSFFAQWADARTRRQMMTRTREPGPQAHGSVAACFPQLRNADNKLSVQEFS